MERNIIFSVRNDMVEGLIEISRTIRGLVPLGRPAHISTKKVRTNLSRILCNRCLYRNIGSISIACIEFCDGNTADASNG